MLARSAAMLALLLAVAAPAMAQGKPPLKLALEVEASHSPRGNMKTGDSVTRRVFAQIKPLFEADGYEVVRVKDVSRAATSKRYHLAARVAVDAKPVKHVRDAILFEDENLKHFDVDYSESVTVWGRWEAWDGMTGRKLAGDRIEPITARLQSAGSGGPELDDEESVSRVFAQDAHEILTAALGSSRALR